MLTDDLGVLQGLCTWKGISYIERIGLLIYYSFTPLLLFISPGYLMNGDSIRMNKKTGDYLPAHILLSTRSNRVPSYLPSQTDV